jgi:hypothetical protein
MYTEAKLENDFKVMLKIMATIPVLNPPNQELPAIAAKNRKRGQGIN